MPKQEVEPVGVIRQVNLGFEAGGKKADHSQADHLCDLKLGDGGVFGAGQLHILEFCFCSLCSLVHCRWRKILD